MEDRIKVTLNVDVDVYLNYITEGDTGKVDVTIDIPVLEARISEKIQTALEMYNESKRLERK